MGKTEILTDAGASKFGIAKTAWFQATARYARSNLRRSIAQLLNTLVPYFALWGLMIYTVQRQFPYWVTLLLALVGGGTLVRIFILFHDCCHGSFFVSRRANTLLGYCTGILTFTPFEDWRLAHNTHHATAGDLDRRGVGDIWTLTTQEYLAAPILRRIAYRFYRNPLILLGPGAALHFLGLQRWPSKGAGRRERRSVWRTNVALLIIVGLAAWTIGLKTYLSIQLPIILSAGSAGIWLFYVQHQFDQVYWTRRKSWNPLEVALQGSSYFKLPKILQWFTGNIGLHHIHHIRPNIPNYNLQRCHEEVAAFHFVRALTLGASLRTLRLGLYDERQKKMIRFRALRTLDKRIAADSG